MILLRSAVSILILLFGFSFFLVFPNMAKVSPPIFGGVSYELYKRELQAWEAVTDVAKEKRGVIIALSLPDSHESKIKEKVFESVPLEDLKKENGLETLIQFLDKHLQKDDLEEAWQRFEEFEECSKTSAESMTKYIDDFDRKYTRIKEKGVTIPENLLAFKLLKGAGLTRDERLVIMTGIQLDKDTIYQEAKQSLKKYKGECLGASGVNNRFLVKEEPAYIATSSGFASRPSNFPRRGRNARKGSAYGQFNRNKETNPVGRDGNVMACSKCSSTRHLYNACPHKDGESKLNPIGRDGKRMTCNSCFSTHHFLSSCPHSWETFYTSLEIAENNNRNPNIRVEMAERNNGHPNSQNEDHIVLFTGDIQQLQKEAFKMAVIDSACSSSVAGEQWLKQYLDYLPAGDRVKVKQDPSGKIFKFGGGTRLVSDMVYTIPGLIAGKPVLIKTDVVKSDIPLLLSRTAMKAMDCKMDFEKDTAELFGEKVNMHLTSSGHYCIPIGFSEEEVNLVAFETLDKQELKSKVSKLHRQFAHPSEDKFKKLLKDAGCVNTNLSVVIEDIYKTCEICKAFAPTPPRPVVCMPLAQEFNQCVAMDLKTLYTGQWILYMIDVFTRYTMAQLISRKLPSTIIEQLIQRWIAIFGVMGGIITDNGGEFTADELKEVGSLLDMRILSTGAESPFQNGLCERVHAVTDNMISKLQAQYPKTDIQVLIAWACMAKNSLQMFNGFSSNQLVFGTNPKLPGVSTDSISALEDTTSSQVFANHLNVLHAARRSFIESESEERIRRALRSKLRVNEKTFSPGDIVYYKRECSNRWMGPGKVLAQDGKVIFVRHGNSLVRVSANRLADANNVRFDSCEEGDLISEEKESGVEPSLTNSESETETEIETRDNQIIQDNQDNQDNPQPVRRSLRLFNKDHCEEDNYVYMVTIPKSRHQDEDCIQAKEEELKKLRDFQVYEEVQNFGQRPISTRWILWKKGATTRARLVARGFEESLDSYVDSPTIGKCVVRIVLSTAVSYGWTIQSTDIKSAFLQGLPLERDVYIKPPREAEAGNKLWKLKKCLYGLNDAARQFYDCVRQELLGLGCKSTSLDPSLFFFREGDSLSGIIVSHIDDFLHCGNTSFQEKVVDKLCTRFCAGSKQSEEFKYVGYQVVQKNGVISINQHDYIANAEIPQLQFNPGGGKEDVLSDKDVTFYRSMVGMLNWVVQSTRPDLAFDMVDLSTRFKCAKIEDLKRVKKIVTKLRSEKSEIVFPDLGPFSTWKLAVFSDASFGNLSGGVDSCGGFLIFLSAKCKSCPIVWKSGRVQRVVKSTLAAEGLSLSEALDEAIYVRHVLCQIFSVPSKSEYFAITGITDHEGLCRNIRSTKLVEDRRLRLDIASIKQNIARGEVSEVILCSSGEQLADVLTKKGVSGDKLLSVLQTGGSLGCQI